MTLNLHKAASDSHEGNEGNIFTFQSNEYAHKTANNKDINNKITLIITANEGNSFYEYLHQGQSAYLSVCPCAV